LLTTKNNRKQLWYNPESGVRRKVRIPYPYLISRNNPYLFPYPYQIFSRLRTRTRLRTFFLKSTRTPYQIPYLFWKITRTCSRPRTHFFDFSYVPKPVPISVHFPYTSRTRDFWSRRYRGNLMRLSKNHLRILKNQPFDKKNCLRR